jgi:nicotinamide phosphoribosyltransferase
VVRDVSRLVARRRDTVRADEDLMEPVWRNGAALVRHSFADIRARAA